MKHTQPNLRTGAVAVETAIIMPIFFLFIFGILIVGIGVFRFQQITWLSQEAARWASVRTGKYQTDTGLPSPTQQQIIDAAVTPNAIGLDPQNMTVTILFIDSGTNTATSWDSTSLDFRSINSTGEYVSNRVRVTVTYPWIPAIFGSPTLLSSTTERTLTN